MSVQLNQQDFQQLARLLAAQTQWQLASGRVALVSFALEGAARGQDILMQLALDGPPLQTAIDTLRVLAQFGRVTPDQEALGILISALLLYKGEADPEAQYLRALAERYQLNQPVRRPPLAAWRGRETPSDLREKIIGENTLRHIATLEQALIAAQAVVRIVTPDGYGTGFVCGPHLMLTNNHVIENAAVAGRSVAQFNFQLDRNGIAQTPLSVAVQPDRAFYTNSDLDFTLVALERLPDGVTPLRLQTQLLPVDSRVAIIQHPGGHYKQIALQNNFVAYADQRVVQYTTSTLPGSSGSPVFNDQYAVVAIHHSGGMLEEPGSTLRHLRNAGTTMTAVLADLRANAPGLLADLALPA